MSEQGMGMDAFEQLMNDLKPAETTTRSFVPRDDGPREFLRVYMAGPPNYGTVHFVPINSADGKYVGVLDNVAEFKLLDEKGDVTGPWLKLLHKDMYGFEEGSKEELLYGEIRSLFFEYRDLFSWRKRHARFRTYTLIFGYIMKHYNLESGIVNENTLAMIVLDQREVKDSLSQSIKSQSDIFGSSNWLPRYFNRNTEGRKHYVRLSYQRGEGGKPITAIQFQPITEDFIGVTGGLEVSLNKELVDKYITDHVSVLLNNENWFDYEYFLGVKEKLQSYLKTFSKSNPPAEAQEFTNPNDPIQ